MAIAMDGASQGAAQIAVSTRPSRRLLTRLMTGSFLLVTLGVLAGHMVGFLPAHA